MLSRHLPTGIHNGPDRWVVRSGKTKSSDTPIILRLAAHTGTRLTTTMPNFSIVGKAGARELYLETEELKPSVTWGNCQLVAAAAS